MRARICCGAYSSLDAAPFTAVARSGSLPTPPVSKCVRFLRMNTLEFVRTFRRIFCKLGPANQANLWHKFGGLPIETLAGAKLPPLVLSPGCRRWYAWRPEAASRASCRRKRAGCGLSQPRQGNARLCVVSNSFYNFLTLVSEVRRGSLVGKLPQCILTH